MDLLDRYLQAVGTWLPSDRKQDILAELREDVRSEIDDRSAALGRPLGADEVASILTRWGHPTAVAERYLPRRQFLIGPVTFPVYRLVLKIAALGYLLPWLGVWIGLLVFDPARRTDAAVASTLTTFWLTTLHVVVGVTAAFAIVEWQRTNPQRLAAWDARELIGMTARKDARAIPRSDSVVDLACGVILSWWWLTLSGTPVALDLEQTVRITFVPLASRTYWLILAFLGAGIVLACLNLRRPWWTRASARARLVIDLAGVLLSAAMIAQGPVVEIVTHARPDLDRLVVWANVSWYATLAVIGVYCLVRAVQAARHATRAAGLPAHAGAH